MVQILVEPPVSEPAENPSTGAPWESTKPLFTRNGLFGNYEVPEDQAVFVDDYSVRAGRIMSYTYKDWRRNHPRNRGRYY